MSKVIVIKGVVHAPIKNHKETSHRDIEMTILVRKYNWTNFRDNIMKNSRYFFTCTKVQFLKINYF
jgi:hypothetical protein